MAIEFDQDVQSPVRVFVSYSSADRSLATGLIERLSQGYPGVKFQVYSDLELDPGDVFIERLREWLQDAQIVLILVSPAYLASSAGQAEALAAMERRERGMTIVVPVLLANPGEAWPDSPLRNLQALPPGAKPVDEWPDAEQAFREIGASLAGLVARRRVASPSRNTMATPVLARTSFRTAWLVVASYLILSIVLFLGWYARNPNVATPPDGASPTSQFVLQSAAAGLTAMALIQIGRRLLRVRGAFHRGLVLRWLGQPAMDELYKRFRTGSVLDMFDLPSEMLTGQLSALAEQALEEQLPGMRPSPLIAKMSLVEPSFTERARATAESTAENTPDGRSLVAFAIQRNLDHFQIAASAQWKRYLLLTCILLSAVLFAIGLKPLVTGSFVSKLLVEPVKFVEWAGNFGVLLASATLVGLFGGLLGSIARDVVAIIEKLRR